MSELSPHAQAALAALQADTADDAQKQRVRARLVALGVAVGAGSAGVASAAAAATLTSATAAGSGASGAATAQASLASGWLAKLAVSSATLKSGAAVAVVATVLGAGLVDSPLRTSSATRTQAPSAAAGASRGVATPKTSKAGTRPAELEDAKSAAVAGDLAAEAEQAAPQLSAQDAMPSADLPPPSSPRVKRARLAEAAPVAPVEEVARTLALEGALLEDALRALRTGESARAHELLERHERQFGQGALLAPERERMKRELSRAQSGEAER